MVSMVWFAPPSKPVTLIFFKCGVRSCLNYYNTLVLNYHRYQHKTPMEAIEPIYEVTDLEQLLSVCELPVSDVAPSDSMLFFGCRHRSKLVGLVGLEVYKPVALLRSLAVAPQYRNSRLGKKLVTFAEEHAASLGVQWLYLLTTNADGYFLKLGYSPVSRENAPLPIKNTAQFSGLCPASSKFMSKQLSH